MKRLMAAVGLVLASSAGALADSCDVNASTPAYSPDDTSISIIFDYFFAFPSNPGTCALSILAHNADIDPADTILNDPDLFEVYSADVRGGFLVPDDEALVTIEHNGRVSSGTLEDASFDPVTHYIGKEGDGTLTSNIKVKLTVANDPASEVEIQSVDYTRIATMTRADAEDSIDQIGLSQVGLVTHLDETASLLTSGNLPLEGGDEFGFVGAIGSFTVGANFRYNLGDGFSVLGGVSIIDMGAGGASATGGLGAAAIRYVQPGGESFRLFGEGGVQAAALGLSFARTYTDTGGTHTVSGSGDGWLGAAYLRGGVLFAPDDRNEVVVSATVKQSMLGIGTYAEQVTSGNLFAADMSGTNAAFTTVKAGVDWTTQIAPDLDLTASVAIGSTAGNGGTSAYIFGGGDVVGSTQSAAFAEYGLRLGWDVTPASRLDGFVLGSTGVGVGTHAQVGAGYHLTY